MRGTRPSVTITPAELPSRVNQLLFGVYLPYGAEKSKNGRLVKMDPTETVDSLIKNMCSEEYQLRHPHDKYFLKNEDYTITYEESNRHELGSAKKGIVYLVICDTYMQSAVIDELKSISFDSSLYFPNLVELLDAMEQTITPPFVKNLYNGLLPQVITSKIAEKQYNDTSLCLMLKVMQKYITSLNLTGKFGFEFANSKKFLQEILNDRLLYSDYSKKEDNCSAILDIMCGISKLENDKIRSVLHSNRNIIFTKITLLLHFKENIGISVTNKVLTILNNLVTCSKDNYQMSFLQSAIMHSPTYVHLININKYQKDEMYYSTNENLNFHLRLIMHGRYITYAASYSRFKHESYLENISKSKTTEDVHKVLYVKDEKEFNELLNKGESGVYPLFLLSEFFKNLPELFKVNEGFPLLKASLHLSNFLLDKFDVREFPSKIQTARIIELVYSIQMPFLSFFQLCLQSLINYFNEFETDFDQLFSMFKCQFDIATSKLENYSFIEFQQKFLNIKPSAIIQIMENSRKTLNEEIAASRPIMELKNRKKQECIQLIRERKMNLLLKGQIFQKAVNEKRAKMIEKVKYDIQLMPCKKKLLICEKAIVSIKKKGSEPLRNSVLLDRDLISLKILKDVIVIKSLVNEDISYSFSHNSPQKLDEWKDGLQFWTLQPKIDYSNTFKKQLQELLNLEMAIQTLELQNVTVRLPIDPEYPEIDDAMLQEMSKLNN